MMFSRGSNGFLAPYAAATRGISCIRPIAPTRDTAPGLKFDSVWMTDRMTCGSIAYCSAASLMMSSMPWFGVRAVAPGFGAAALGRAVVFGRTRYGTADDLSWCGKMNAIAVNARERIV